MAGREALTPPRRGGRVSIVAQAVLGMVALIVLALWPPRSGAMLLVPLPGTDSGGMAVAAISAGAMLLGRGPLPGSLVVSADRARLSDRIGALRTIVIAAPPALCGTAALIGSST